MAKSTFHAGLATVSTLPARKLLSRLCTGLQAEEQQDTSQLLLLLHVDPSRLPLNLHDNLSNRCCAVSMDVNRHDQLPISCKICQPLVWQTAYFDALHPLLHAFLSTSNQYAIGSLHL